MLPLPRKAVTQEKTNTFTDQRRPTYHSRPQTIQDNLDSRIETHPIQHTRRGGDKKISEWAGSLGHDMCYNYLELWTPWTVITWCPTVPRFLFCFGFLFSFLPYALCIVGKTRVLLDRKNKHKPIDISWILTTRACGRPRRAGLMDSFANRDCGCPPLTLFARHVQSPQLTT